MDIERGCRSKQAYLSKRHAKQVARLMTEREGEPLHQYLCPNCHYRHIGHDVPSALRAAARERPWEAMELMGAIAW